jgi:O-methyltransferase
VNAPVLFPDLTIRQEAKKILPMDDATFSERYLDLLKSAICASLYEESAWRFIEGPMRQHIPGMSPRRRIIAKSKHLLIGFLRNHNLGLVRTIPFEQARRDNGLDWPMFGFSMTGRRRLDALHKCIDDIIENKIPGDLIETGVWRGGSVIFMRALLDVRSEHSRIVWCADSFEGMPVPKDADLRISSEADFSDRGYLAVSLAQVQNNFAKFGLLNEQVRFLKGWFSETLPTAPIKQLSLLRLDGDLYESTLDSLDNLYDKVSPGGYIIIDDYNSWGGCQTAVNDFRRRRGISEPLQDIDSHSVFWRVPHP